MLLVLPANLSHYVFVMDLSLFQTQKSDDVMGRAGGVWFVGLWSAVGGDRLL